MRPLFQSVLRIASALVIASSLAMAANNPDITIGASTDGPRYIAIGTGATINATLHWPSDATPVSGTFTWTADPNNLGSFSPSSTTGSSTSSTSFFGSRAGTTTIKVRWVPSESGYDTAESTKSVTIVEIASLSVTEAQRVGSTTTYAACRGDGNVLVEAILNPSVSASDLPSGFILWAGGVAGDNLLQRKVTKSIPDSTNVVALVGSSSKDVTIKVYEITSLSVAGAQRHGETNTYVTKKDVGDVVLTAQLNPSASSSELPAGFITWTPATLAGDDQLSRKVSKATAASTEVTVTCGYPTKSAKIIVADISTTVANATRVLMETNDFSMTLTPSSETWTGHKIEIKRASGSSWFTLAEAEQASGFVQRVAGTFKIRSKATVAGLEIISVEKDLEVKFPDITVIASHVSADAQAAWAETLAATVDNSRREQGWWITLDTSSGSYGKSGECVGTPVPNSAGAILDTWQPKPADNPTDPSPIASSIYLVGWFHTHTPTTFRTAADIGSGRPTGPSGPPGGDAGVSAASQTPGIAYDYIINPAPPLYPLNSPAKMYFVTPPDRRPTP